MKVLAGVLVTGLSVACASPGGTHPAGPDATAQAPLAANQVTAETADVVITQFEQPTPVRVGQTVGLTPFRPSERWQVSFSNHALQLLTPADHLAAPGAEGWVWKAIAPGPVEITFTMVADCVRPPCAPNVLQTRVTLEVSAP